MLLSKTTPDTLQEDHSQSQCALRFHSSLCTSLSGADEAKSDRSIPSEQQSLRCVSPKSVSPHSTASRCWHSACGRIAAQDCPNAPGVLTLAQLILLALSAVEGPVRCFLPSVSSALKGKSGFSHIKHIPRQQVIVDLCPSHNISPVCAIC